MSDGFPLLLIDPSGFPSADSYRQKQEQEKKEVYARYRAMLTDCFEGEFPELENATEIAALALDTLFGPNLRGINGGCVCSCHPSLPSNSNHDFGFDCRCTWDDERREREHQKFLESMESWWASPEYQEYERKAEAEELALQEWLARHPEIQVGNHGGMAPEQWEGEVDGRSFYFRERHGHWRIEIDLQPTGDFYTTLEGTDENGEPIYGEVPVTMGKVIAEGSLSSPNYGETPVERIQFISNTIRKYISDTSASE